MATRRVPVGEVELEVLEAGAGGRPLLAVHGFTGAKEDFADAPERLAAEGWHVVAPDLRGHGASDHPEGRASYSLDRFTSDMVDLVDALGWGRFVLVGHSMGGMVAQLVALRRPERVRALALLNTSPGPPEGYAPELVDLARQLVTQGGMALLVDVQRQMESDLGSPAHRRLLAERTGYREFNYAKTLAASPDMWLALVDEMFTQPDRSEALAALEVPTLVLVGEQDDAFFGPSKRLAEAVPGARLVVVADAGHLPQFEAPDAWWSAFGGFLQDLR